MLCLFVNPAFADTVLAVRTIPAHALILPTDVTVNSHSVPGSITDPAQVIGMEARVALYAGRPISPSDIGFPAVVERNQIIFIYYQHNGILISTEGRALGRGGPGDVIRVMNVSSRTTVTAQIGSDGAGYVTQ